MSEIYLALESDFLDNEKFWAFISKWLGSMYVYPGEASHVGQLEWPLGVEFRGSEEVPCPQVLLLKVTL